MFEQEKQIIQEYLNLFSKKLQEIQLNQQAIGKNQETLAIQNNKIIQALIKLDQDLFTESPDPTELDDPVLGGK